MKITQASVGQRVSTAEEACRGDRGAKALLQQKKRAEACVCVAQAHLGKKKRAEACCGQFYLRCLQLVWVQRSFCCCFPQLEALGLSTDDFLAGCTMDDIELLEEGLVPCKLVKRWSECSCAWDFQNCSAMETPDTRGFQRGPWSAFWFELFTKPGCFERRR
ncbi:unnamed protein product [Durusdinium trenchii]|uniref:Uncharacterized protein n=1 Tax=Durusdinium trenchii TaxID=1381693 RepID=A0ABP0P5Y1_9DINO